MNNPRALAWALMASLPLVLVPAVVASAVPTAPPSPEPAGGGVIDGPDIAAGAKNAPGTQAISDIVDALGFYAIVACLIGLLLSGLILAIGPRLGFNQASTLGKIGIIASLGVAFLVGMAAPLINYFYNAGT